MSYDITVDHRDQDIQKYGEKEERYRKWKSRVRKTNTYLEIGSVLAKERENVCKCE